MDDNAPLPDRHPAPRAGQAGAHTEEPRMLKSLVLGKQAAELGPERGVAGRDRREPRGPAVFGQLERLVQVRTDDSPAV